MKYFKVINDTDILSGAVIAENALRAFKQNIPAMEVVEVPESEVIKNQVIYSYYLWDYEGEKNEFHMLNGETWRN